MSMVLNPYRYAAGGTTFGNASRDFDGVNDYIDLGFSHDGSAFSIALWAKLDGTPAEYDILMGTNWNEGFALHYDSGQWRFWAQYWDINRASASVGTHTVWNHFVGTYAGGGLGAVKLYINGTKGTDGTATGRSTTVTARIGAVASGFYVDGKIADVRYYTRELSASEASDLAAGTDVTSGLYGHWLKNTDDVLDHVGSNDGTNYGSTYSTDGPFD